MNKEVRSLFQNQAVAKMVAGMGPSFAKALAVFVTELVKQDIIEIKLPQDTPQVSELPSSWEELPASVREEYETEIKRNNSRAAKENLQPIEITEDSPAIAIANRIKYVLKQQGISQKELAERLHVNPSHISRVLKNPERSKLATLQDISKAIGVDLRSIV